MFRVVLLALIFAAASTAADDPRNPARAANGAAFVPAEQQNADEFRSLNEASRLAYRQAKEAALARGGPVILIGGDEISLRYGVFRSHTRFTPSIYHDLKTVSHVPLAIYALLSGIEGKITDKRVFDLKTYRKRVAAAGKSLDGRGLTAAQLRRQESIIEMSLKFLDGLVEEGCMDQKRLTAFARQMRPLLEDNTRDAARAQVNALHKQVETWRETLTPSEWKELTVVVMGTQLPRQDNLAVQYFARRLGERGEGSRIVYAEAIFDEEKALDLLATHRVDTGIGVSFFEDPQRMHRDLLGDAARAYLREHFKEESR
jgi:hypothetical protein